MPLANLEMGEFTFPEAPVSNPCNNIVLWWTFTHPLHPVTAFACCVTCPTLTVAESMVKKPFLQAHGEVDCIVIVITLSHFASDLANNPGSNWLAEILQFCEVIPKSNNHRIIIPKTSVTGLTFCLVNRRHTRRCGNLFYSFPLLLTKVKKLAESRKAQGVNCNLASCQLIEISCIIRQLVDLSCSR
jgi:hypothetical protein